MDGVPPRVARRLLLAPAAVLLGIVAVVLGPFVLVAALAVDAVLRRPLSTTRLATVALAHVVFEAAGVIALFGLWIASGFGLAIRSPRMQALHHRFLRAWLGLLLDITSGCIGIVVVVEGRQPPRSGPVLVFSRHAGPWDSFLLAHALTHDYRRRPRIVMKAAMQWSPMIDIIGNRLPNRFIRPHGPDAGRFLGEIETLARGIGVDEALILFPEGGNFSERRRLAAISRLRERGDAEHADDAARLEHVVAPHPGGVLAALRGAPDADVVFVAHTGLEPLASLRELWRRTPLRTPLIGRYWRLPGTAVPETDPEIVDWLFGWWERIDTWIEQHPATSARAGVREEARS